MTKPRVSALPPSLPPFGLSRVLAAEVVGVSTSTFDKMVADGMMPKPRKIYSRRVWLRPEIEAAMFALEVDGEAPVDAYDEWAATFEPMSHEERAATELAGWDRRLLLALYRRGQPAPASTLEGAGPVSRRRLAERGLITDIDDVLQITSEGISLAKHYAGSYSPVQAPPPSKAPRAPKAPAPSLQRPDGLIAFRFTVGFSEKKLASKLGLLEMKVLRQLYPFDGRQVSVYDILGAGDSTRGLLYARGFIEELGTGNNTWLAITEAGKRAYEKQKA